MQKWKRGLLLFLTGIFLCGCATSGDSEEYRLPEDEKLVVYTSHKKEIYEPIIKEFEERSGIWVEVVYGGTNELLTKIAFEDGGSYCDVMFGGGVDSLESYSEYFQPYHTSQYEFLDSSYASATDSYTVFSRLPLVIIYNTKLVIQAGTPRSFQELLNVRWKGKIAFADPMRSGSSYTALMTIIQELSPEYSPQDVVSLLCENLEQDVAEESSQVIEDVIMGRKLVGITLEETALKYIAKGEDIGMVYPEEGTTAVPDGCAIVKNSPHRENAELFVDFIVSEDVQRLLEEQLFRRSVRNDLAQKTSLREVIYDMAYAEEHREEILECWEQH